MTPASDPKQENFGEFFGFCLGSGKGRKPLRRSVRIDPDRFWCETDRSRPILSQIWENDKIRLGACALCSQETYAGCSQETHAVCSQETHAVCSQETHAVC